MMQEKNRDLWDEILEKVEESDIHWNAKNHRINTVLNAKEFIGDNKPTTPHLAEFVYNQIKVNTRTRWGVARLMQDISKSDLKKYGGIFYYAVLSPGTIVNTEAILDIAKVIKLPSVRVYFILRCCGIKQSELVDAIVSDYSIEKRVFLEKYKLPSFASIEIEKYLDRTIKPDLCKDDPFLHKSEKNEDGFRKPETLYMIKKHVKRAGIIKNIDIFEFIRNSKNFNRLKKGQLVRYCTRPNQRKPFKND